MSPFTIQICTSVNIPASCLHGTWTHPLFFLLVPFICMAIQLRGAFNVLAIKGRTSWNDVRYGENAWPAKLEVVLPSTKAVSQPDTPHNVEIRAGTCHEMPFMKLRQLQIVVRVAKGAH
jgi:hypothetical protein